jgi:ubiquinone/menaquinone biosynthesis C-methylase UbiE
MPAAYDMYDYPSYWIGRVYEHKSEALAIKEFLNRISNINKALEIGCGYGRLVPDYLMRSKRITLSDPSARLLSLARKKYKKYKKIEFIQANISTLENSLKYQKFDLILLVRVLHHIENASHAFKIVHKLLNNHGYFILEFPNKRHIKASLKKLLKGDFTFPLDIFSIDLRSKKALKKGTLPFINYHPDKIIEDLKNAGFEIIETRSVSNIRSTLLKRLFPLYFLIDIERLLQVVLSKIYFGPSIFILCRKKG